MTGLSDYERHTKVAKALLKNTAVDNHTEDYTRALLANAHATLALAAATREAATPQRLTFDPTSHVPAVEGSMFTPAEFDQPVCLCSHPKEAHGNRTHTCMVSGCRCEQYVVVCIDCQGTGDTGIYDRATESFAECETCGGTGYVRSGS